MPTFTNPGPLTQQITFALRVLRDARFDGGAQQIMLASARLDRLIDRYSAKYAQKSANDDNDQPRN